MKLASLKHGRDGRLMTVSRDLTRMADATSVAPTLQAAIDDWATTEPRLRELSRQLEIGSLASVPFDQAYVASPFPRAYQWLDGSAYVNHVALVRQARGAVVPESFWTDPLMYQGGSDIFLAPRDPIEMDDEGWGIDYEAEIAVVVDDVPMAPTREEAAAAIKLVVLVNDISLRIVLMSEIKKELGFVHAKPSSALSPVAVTPDELGSAWDGGLLHLPMLSFVNGQLMGKPNAGIDMTFDFPTLIMHAAKTRRLSAGTLIGSGTISNRDADGGCGKPVTEGGLGYSCIAETRSVETILHGAPATPFLRFDDIVAIEMKDWAGQSIFGRIEQRVVRRVGGGLSDVSVVTATAQTPS
ncbi:MULTISPECIES: fumarylacetoacetate hydrolase family protein [unclassified Chelatococcus]|uniref:fumarylacetoacetate hydrolase family protein n=1 Tax=unclassified Chelatococcus TaxID=2638111 RepID=UPI001BCFFC4D|nr:MULTISPECIES: fumarylacetoacetate hydrolase family protein [unclassified Chelatococcus]MBS7743500.1 fumarylacetoacetate hydrolase family protein [Chelatococcus sp. HY11]MBX3547021.1 fumarylacetoacetate hydrolase family protein [Chelatococcus sp.]CAH1662386.1 Fumarylacetoacetase [Hyphomicrobiales bacterium]CAH1687584.1 Fumarylacetoacetase [Hyphomicrobiales bacterium]